MGTATDEVRPSRLLYDFAIWMDATMVNRKRGCKLRLITCIPVHISLANLHVPL